MRRKRNIIREINPDVKYGNILIAKFINYLMGDGKKTIAQKIIYDSFDILEEKNKKNALEVFDSAVKNVSPQMEIKSKRIGGANYQVPREVRGERKIALAARWLIQAAESKKGKSMAEKLAEEFLLASNNEGSAIKKRADVQRMAEANRAFAHFGR